MKKEVAEKIKSFFEKELREIDHKIWKNKSEMKKLVNEQTILKRTRAELDKLSRSINTKIK